MDNQPEV